MKKTWLILLPFIILMLGACVNVQETKPQKTQLEIRQLQTRSYDTKDVKMVMKAVMHALQDDNFIIQQANVELGLLTAQKEVDLIEKPTDFSWKETAIAIGVVAVVIGAAIAILGKSGGSNESHRSHGSGLDFDKNNTSPSFKKSAITEASANISDFGEQTQVRMSFQLKVLDNQGATAEVKQIDHAKFYQDFFSKVDKSVFLGKENLQ
ncbi:hypothetical protein [Candidatus Parabeggiatoa sp. HSG14]|uniref:hypothetical protein n=1 Tax=Candidatus Parabeggiatoa sp. HSG14 TaxID=3055593 RepID=UPI0025A6C3F7|nr:hypothetical protein [Thiotrichales bacterium HSG14]